MALRVKSNLKAVLDQKGISIRQLSEMTDNRVKFETIRRLYNDDTKQYQRDSLGIICEVLDIEIQDILQLVESKEPTKH